MTLTQAVEQAWQRDRARQQQAAEAIQAAMARPRATGTPHDTPDAATGALRASWALAA